MFHVKQRRRKLHMPRFGLKAKARSLRCASFFLRDRFAGSRRRGDTDLFSGFCLLGQLLLHSVFELLEADGGGSDGTG